MSVFTGNLFNALKLTLEKVIDDRTDNVESSALVNQWLEQRTMSDYYEDDLESAGPGLASEKDEGTEMATGTIREGYLTRYISKTFALKLIITEEAMEDVKYPKILSAARRLKRALWKTVDIETTQMLVRMFNSSYVGGDGQPLGSASHTLPDGGTWSNVMGTPVAPSKAAVVTATSDIRKFPGHDGLTEGYEPVRVLCPTEQWATWSELLNSQFNPTTNNFATINVVNSDLDLSAVPNKYWNNTELHWAILTDAPDKLNVRWRRRPRNRSWVDNAQELMMYGISSRWSRGWSDPRAIYCVQDT